MDSAKKILNGYGLDIKFKDYVPLEIQTDDISELVSFSCQQAGSELKAALIFSRVGYYIHCLNGFPGTHIKYVNTKLTGEQLIALVGDSKDRMFSMKTCLGLYIPGNIKPILFESMGEGTIALKAEGTGTPLDRIIVRKGMKKVQGLYSYKEVIDYLTTRYDHYHKLARYIQLNPHLLNN